MLVEVTVPDLELSPPATLRVSVWFAEEGEPVYIGERLVELQLPGATFDVDCPADGVLQEIVIPPNRAVRAGQVLALITTPDPPADGAKEQ
jgi:pyruvate dehydrogenase E2 component (dihydrolipoamide acetyltransferase)